MARRTRQQRRQGGRADRNSDGLQDEVLSIRVHSKVTKGGRTLSFSALVAVGDGKGKVGLGYGKARGVPGAIEKANKMARRAMITVPMIGDTVCHEQIGEHKSSRVMLKPAARGTGVKAGAAVRAIMNVTGVNNVLTKSLGRNNPVNLAKATMHALEQMRPVGEVQSLRGVNLTIRHPQMRPVAAGGQPAPQQPQAPVEPGEQQGAQQAEDAAPPAQHDAEAPAVAQEPSLQQPEQQNTEEQ